MSEPTSKFNDLSSETVTKLVSIIVAIVVFAVVLVPIVNGLADGDGEGDGGDSGDSEKVMLNTFESTQGFDLTPYNSYQLYFSDTTSTLPQEITYTLEDLNEISSIWDSRFEETEEEITILEAIDESLTGVRITYSEGKISATIMHNGSGAMEFITDATSFNLTISVGYQLDCSYTIVYPAGSDPRTESVQTTVKTVKQLSESEDGWMELSRDLLNKISVGSEVMLGAYIDSIGEEWYKTIMITEDMISNNHLQFIIDWGEGYTSDVDLELQSTDMADVWKFTDVYDWYGTIKDNGMEIDSEDTSCWIQYLSTYGYVQSESGSGSGGGSGSGSDSAGITGTAGTILKIIPVLVGVGVILAIVALFYDPRNLIKKD